MVVLKSALKYCSGFLILLVFGGLLGACSQVNAASDMNTASPSALQQVEEPLDETLLSRPALPSPTPVDKLSETPNVSQSIPTAQPATAVKPSSTTAPLASESLPTAGAPSESPVICSPLSIIEIQELSKIISSPYAPPPMGRDDRHQGVDFSYHHWEGTGPIRGVGVQSVLPGVVAASLKDTFPYGNLVLIETRADQLPRELHSLLEEAPDQSLYTMYAHLEGPPWVKLGQQVNPCQLVGLVGGSGNAVVPHLHLETRTGPSGMTFTGLSRFTEEAKQLEKENYLLWRTSGQFIHFDPMKLFESDPAP
jgi:murein DD-endopeptidase MepM/ murein hydrolase activator NlpD